MANTCKHYISLDYAYVALITVTIVTLLYNCSLAPAEALVVVGCICLCI